MIIVKILVSVVLLITAGYCKYKCDKFIFSEDHLLLPSDSWWGNNSWKRKWEYEK